MIFIPQDAIFRVDYNGNKRQTIRSNLPSPRGLTVLKGDIFWVDRNLATVFKASKLPNQVAAPETVKSGLEGLRDIAMVDRQNQPLDKNNPCYVLGNGYCDQLCFSYPQVKLTPSLHSGAKLHAVLPDSKNFEAGILKKLKVLSLRYKTVCHKWK